MTRTRDLLLIRHAATNMSGTFCGHSDPPLNAAGKAQAAELAYFMQQWPIQRLYTSDLRRAAETAQVLGRVWNIVPEAKYKLREISFGDWEGKRSVDIRDLEPDITTLETSPELCAPGGETFGSFGERVLRGVDEIALACAGAPAAIVTHLGVIRLLLKTARQVECVRDADQRIAHCCVYHTRL